MTFDPTGSESKNANCHVPAVRMFRPTVPHPQMPHLLVGSATKLLVSSAVAGMVKRDSSSAYI